MPVSATLTTTELSNQFGPLGVMNPAALGPLVAAATARMNGPPFNLNVNGVTAEIVQNGHAVTFTMNAPANVQPPQIKAALR